MAIRVLIVDDSHFFCRRVGTMLNCADDIKIVGLAHNGQEAILKAKQLNPDVITLDVEMPVMDGVTALKKIIKICDAKVLMLSSLTYENAKVTLDALDAGAVDFLLKSYEALSSEKSSMVKLLQQKIRDVYAVNATAFNNSQKKLKPDAAQQNDFSPLRKPVINPQRSSRSKLSIKPNNKVVAIGASTGGPVAVQKVIRELPVSYPLPIVVIQHMPATFTGAFASRLDGLCQLKVIEAQDGMPLEKGTVYIAPGGKQMTFSGDSRSQKITIRPSDARIKFSPSVDISLASATKIFGKNILAIILTGMGNDGTDGSRLVKTAGGQVWTQDQQSCVVYGMPKSVSLAGLSDGELNIDRFSDALQWNG